MGCADFSDDYGLLHVGSSSEILFTKAILKECASNGNGIVFLVIHICYSTP